MASNDYDYPFYLTEIQADELAAVNGYDDEEEPFLDDEDESLYDDEDEPFYDDEEEDEEDEGDEDEWDDEWDAN